MTDQTTASDDQIGPQVLEFYRSLPFNMKETAASEAQTIRDSNVLEQAYPVLAAKLRRGAPTVEIGCGTGWLSNTISLYYGCSMTGVDFNPVAIERAGKVAAALGVDTRFVVHDLFAYRPERPAEVVVSIGVLHHTHDCERAIRHLCTDVLAPGGHIFIGLYHRYGRRPFLNHFRAMKQRGATEREMLARYAEMHAEVGTDATHLYSWFRDQVLHPHETQHTLKELVPVLDEAGVELVSTSVNRWSAISSRDDLYARELGLEAVAQEALHENRYFPGFFAFLARRPA